jgi:hypothetical protein
MPGTIFVVCSILLLIYGFFVLTDLTFNGNDGTTNRSRWHRLSRSGGQHKPVTMGPSAYPGLSLAPLYIQLSRGPMFWYNRLRRRPLRIRLS